MKDVIIIGGGPAGLCAAMYCARGGLDVMLIEQLFTGGQVAKAHEVENFIGVEKIGGPQLCMNMDKQARLFGPEIKYETVQNVVLDEKIKKIVTKKGEYEAKTVILSMGAASRRLGIKGEAKFKGRGVSYCATCDGNFYKNKIAMIVGGGETALEEALYLTRICEKLYLVHRRDKFRAAKTVSDRVIDNPKIEVILDSVVEEVSGEETMEKAIIKNVKTEKISEIKTDALFIAIGLDPATEIVKDYVELDEGGYIITDEDMKTNVSGVFAAGDIRKKSFRQIITAAADGAIAAHSVEKYLAEEKC